MTKLPDRVANLVDRIEGATPAERDRYLDFVRVVAILMVIVGHWVVRVVTAPDGTPTTGYLLEMQPHWQWGSLIWQVMPLFFLVGGSLNAQSLRRALDAGATPAGWARARLHRLLRPTCALLACIVPLWILAELLVPEALLLEPNAALIPLWFVAAYVMMTALTPLTLALHERGWTLPAITLAVLVAGGLDVARIAGIGPVLGDQSLVSAPNFLLIWGSIYLLGHLWADGRLPSQAPRQAALAAVGAMGLVLLIGLGGWPLSMVPIEGTAELNNVAPPTVALFALALVQTGLVLLARAPLTAALQRPLFWAPVALLGARMMTLFLWHQVALVIMTNLLIQVGWPPLTEAIDARWWAQQPLWVLMFALPLAALVPLVGRFEAPGDDAPSHDEGRWDAIIGGVVLAGAAIGVLVGLGLFDVGPWPALGALALYVAGYRLATGARLTPRPPRQAKGETTR
ncbi:MAG: acyltransferase [Geminicoccaceae bacterium]|nr:MAG: acyltransferase [Geminicoccaceae bacterium]